LSVIQLAHENRFWCRFTPHVRVLVSSVSRADVTNGAPFGPVPKKGCSPALWSPVTPAVPFSCGSTAARAWGRASRAASRFGIGLADDRVVVH